MITVSTFAGKTVAVFGLGKSGVSAALALQAGGAEVWAWDDNESARHAAKEKGVSVADLDALNWDICATLVMSPGVPFKLPAPHPVAEHALAHGCEIVGDIELLYRAQGEAKFIGITGTNGKSTTTALLGHVFRECGWRTEIGGNLGTPALDLSPLNDGGAYVLECSSYQLDLCPGFSPNISVLLNISPDHLERHGNMEGYIAAKKQIFENQSSEDVAILGVDDGYSTEIYEDLIANRHQRVVAVSGVRVVAGGVYAVDGQLVDDLNCNHVTVLDLRDAVALPGVHNHQNAAAAYAVARLSGLSADAICRAVVSYPGLAHRQERVDQINGVLFINDSKATNPDAAAKALDSYLDIYWIAGGRAKDAGFGALSSHIDNVRHAYLVGEAADQLGQFLGELVPCHHSGDILVATQQAHHQATQDQNPGSVVLFSPACASFDQFPNFEVRGDFFKQCVDGLVQTHVNKAPAKGGVA